MKEDFTEYDVKPRGFINYLRYNGHHFNKKLCEFACSKLQYTRDKLDVLLQSNNIEIDGNKLYDAVYVANWCYNTLFGSSITDEKHLALFVKDVFEKESDLIFNRWYADMAKSGVIIEWEDMI